MEAIRLKAARAALALALCLGCVVGAATAVPAAPGEACAAQQSGWVKSGSRWWYGQPGGAYARGWLKVGPSWYYFDRSGWMVTGWQKVDGSWYYLRPSGAMVEGWQRVGSSWYYLAPGSGAMRIGWQKVDGSWYYLRPSGAMAEGWQRIGSSWYYLAPGSGVMRTGWYQVGSKWYWSDSFGAMGNSRWVGDYYLGSSGAMATSQWVGGYYVGADGKWIPGYGQAPVTPASDFEYATGDFVLEGKVGTGSLLGAIGQKPGYQVCDCYGNCYSVTSGGGGGSLAFDCGHGVYITGYKGESSNVIVPDKINGISVVSVDLIGWEADSQSIDVSRCSTLKTLCAGAPQSVSFGSIREVQSVYIGSGAALANLDMSSLEKLAFVEFQGEFPQSFTFGSMGNLESLGGIGLGSLDLEGAVNLRSLRANSGSLTDDTLNLSNCTSLEKVSLINNRLTTFPVSQFPRLRSLSLTGNPIKDAAALKAWGAQSGNELHL